VSGLVEKWELRGSIWLWPNTHQSLLQRLTRD